MFDQYQKDAGRTFKEHPTLDPTQSRNLDWCLGLAGEVGEVEELMKHHIFSKEELNKMALAKELGDVLWYLSAICTTNDIDLSSVAELNMAKLNHRYGNSVYTDEASKDRHATEKKFEDTFIYQNLKAKILRTKAPLNVIFLGPDGSGKTTIAKLVAARLESEGFTYHKCDYQQENKPELAKELLESQTNVIYDRFYYPDDIIYSRVQHEKTSEEPMDWETPYWKSYNEVVRVLDEYNTLYIFVTASEEALKERSTAWKDDYITTDDLSKISTLYDRWKQFVRTRPQFLFELDTTEKPVEECVEAVMDAIRRSQAAFANQAEDTYLERKEEEVDG